MSQRPRTLPGTYQDGPALRYWQGRVAGRQGMDSTSGQAGCSIERDAVTQTPGLTSLTVIATHISLALTRPITPLKTHHATLYDADSTVPASSTSLPSAHIGSQSGRLATLEAASTTVSSGASIDPNARHRWRAAARQRSILTPRLVL